MSICNILDLNHAAGEQDPKYGYIRTPLVSYSLHIVILVILQPQNKTSVHVENGGQRQIMKTQENM